MQIFRSALAACVMKDLANIKEYMPLDRDRLSEEGRRNAERNSRHNTNDENNIEVDSVDVGVINQATQVGRNQIITNNDINDNDDVEFIDDDDEENRQQFNSVD